MDNQIMNSSEHQRSEESLPVQGESISTTEQLVTDKEAGRTNTATDRGDIFGDESHNKVKYRTMSWWQAGIVMVAETISLGILTLPDVLATLGLIGGLILLVVFGFISTYTGYTIGQFRQAYPQVHNMADAAEILFAPLGLGRVGREIVGAAQLLFLVFIMGAHVLAWIIAMNTLTGHAACSILWGFIGLVVLLIFTVPRTLKKMSYLSIASFLSIFAAVMFTMVNVGIERPNMVVQPTTRPTIVRAFSSVSNIVVAYAGHVAFFGFISELKEPNDYPKALFMLQITDTCLYIVTAVVIYCFAGPDVDSPALGSISSLMKKVAYGLALPTIILAGVINAHVAAKYIYVRMFRGTRHMSERTWRSLGTWLGLITALWIAAWVIAESIPVFGDLLGFLAALFASWFTYGFSATFWLFLNKSQWFSNWRKSSLTIINSGIFIICVALCVVGLYTSGQSIAENAQNGQTWSCKNND